ncbi:MAG: tetratricopeptide repeat protein [Bacteroidetes bacterium]|jgi:hypothetical protein|nr:tetratricopeptide repeat protein [Bacteroidota bacterium]
MRKTTLLALLLLGVSTAVTGQQAAQHQNRAASLLLSGEHEAACSELKLAAQLYRSEKEWVPFFSCLTQLTQAYLSVNDLAEAKATAKDALWQSIDLLGRNNNEAAQAAHQLAQVYAAAGRFEDAMQYHSMGLDIRTDMHGQFHPTVSDSYVHIAITCRDAGRLEQAQTHLGKALSILQSTYREEHPETVPVLLQMGKLYKMMGKVPEAKSVYQKAVFIQRQAGGTGTEDFVPALIELARFSSPEERARYFEEADAVIGELGLSAGRAVGETQLFWADAAACQGQLSEALGKGEAAVQALSSLPASDTLKAKAVRLCARTASALGQEGAALEFYDILLSSGIDNSAPVILEAAEAALAAGQDDQAVRWSGPLLEADRGEWGWAARLTQATAYFQRRQLAEARTMLDDAEWQAAPPHLASRAHALAAEAALAQEAYEESMQHITAGLSLVDNNDHFARLQLYAVSGMLHVILAEQDRNALHNLQQSEAAFAAYQRSLSALLKHRPLSPREQRWLEENHITIYGHALEHCFLLYQQRQEKALLAAAFRYMEQAKQLTLYLERSYWQPSRLAQQLRYFSLEGATALYDEQLNAWRENAPSIFEAVPSIVDFQSTLEEQSAQALNYYVGKASLYVLHLTPEGSVLLRKAWNSANRKLLASFVRQSTVDGYRQQGAPVSALLLPSLLKQERWQKLLIFPATQLLALPYAALPWRGQLLGQRYEMYSHVSSSAMLAQWAQQETAAFEGARVGLLPEALHVGSGAIALPTKGRPGSSCQPSILSWIQEGGGQLLTLQQWISKPYQALSVLALPEWRVDSLVAALPKQNSSVNQLLLAEPVPHSERPAASLYALSSWLNSNTRQIVLYPDICVQADAIKSPLAACEQTGNMAKSLLALRQQAAATNNSSIIWQMQIFGAPSFAGRASSNIPIKWILGIIGALILLGWWVKR